MNEKTWTGERLETFVFTENTNEHLHRYAMAMELAAGRKVLDIACGEGYGANLLAGIAEGVWGVDIDTETVQRAAKKYPAPNLHFSIGAADAIPFTDHTFDLAVSFETIEHHDRHEAMMTELKRVLKPGGVLIISSPDKKFYSDIPGYKNPFHVAELYKNEFEALIGKHFRYAQYFSQKTFYGSVIVCEDNNPHTPVKQYNGRYESITPACFGGLYCIAIASDEPLPGMGNSFFDGTEVLKKKMKELKDYTTFTVGNEVKEIVTKTVTETVTSATIQSIKNSRTYRIGAAVVRPFLYVKRMLHA
jgi:ubiquinone/menaquinone biosynthesis C-methylase UbiE